MKTLKLLFIPVIIFIVLSCKKDRLTGDNKVLIGTWRSIPTVFNCGTIPGPPQNPNLILELIEKGKYNLYQNGKKIDSGTLLNKDGFVTFNCSKGKRGYFYRKQILKFNSDSLNIDRDGCGDGYAFCFVRR